MAILSLEMMMMMMMMTVKLMLETIPASVDKACGEFWSSIS